MSEENCSCSVEASCACDTTPVLVFPCSGGSNVGQMTNAAALELDRAGKARMYCLAGVAAHISGMVASSQASRCITIDGCQVACARKSLEHAGVLVEQALVLTDLGFTKNHDFTWEPVQIDQALAALGL